MAMPSLTTPFTSVRKEFTDLFATRSRAVAGILVDMLFLGLWIGGQWLFRVATGGITLAGAEPWAIPIAQAVFGLSTLTPILLYTFWDLQTIALQMRETSDAAQPGTSPRIARPASPAVSASQRDDGPGEPGYGTLAE